MKPWAPCAGAAALVGPRHHALGLLHARGAYRLPPPAWGASSHHIPRQRSAYRGCLCACASSRAMPMPARRMWRRRRWSRRRRSPGGETIASRQMAWCALPMTMWQSRNSRVVSCNLEEMLNLTRTSIQATRAASQRPAAGERHRYGCITLQHAAQ